MKVRRKLKKSTAFKKKKVRRTRKIKYKRKLKTKRKMKYKRKSYKKRRSYKRNKFNKFDSIVMKFDFGGDAISAGATSELLMVGHSYSAKQIWNTLFYVWLRKLLYQCGTHMSSLEDSDIDINGAAAPYYQIGLSWRYGRYGTNAATDQFTTYNILAQSVKATADALFTNFCAAVVSDEAAIVQQEPIFAKLQLYGGNASGQRDWIVGTLDLTRCKVQVNFSSTMKVQNKTLAESAVGTADQHQTDLNNVNPLRAKLYRSKFNKNYFAPYPMYQSDLGGATFNGIVGDDKYGYIRAKPTDFQVTNFREFPGKRDLGYYDEKNFMLQPGQVVIDKLSFRSSLHITRFTDKLYRALNTGSAPSTAEYGKAHMFGFDKLVWDRFNAVNVTPVTVGYEIQQVYTVSCKWWNAPTVPYVTMDLTKYTAA